MLFNATCVVRILHATTTAEQSHLVVLDPPLSPAQFHNPSIVSENCFSAIHSSIGGDLLLVPI
jgi:hypothetical protein